MCGRACVCVHVCACACKCKHACVYVYIHRLMQKLLNYLYTAEYKRSKVAKMWFGDLCVRARERAHYCACMHVYACVCVHVRECMNACVCVHRLMQNLLNYLSTAEYKRSKAAKIMVW